MSRSHLPTTITQKDLVTAKQELLAMAETIELAIKTMKSHRKSELWMYYRSSLDGVNGGLSRLGTFIGGLDNAKRRLAAGNPIGESDRKARSKLTRVGSETTNVAEDESVYKAMQDVIAEMRPEVAKRLLEEAGQIRKRKSK